MEIRFLTDLLIAFAPAYFIGSFRVLSLSLSFCQMQKKHTIIMMNVKQTHFLVRLWALGISAPLNQGLLLIKTGSLIRISHYQSLSWLEMH